MAWLRAAWLAFCLLAGDSLAAPPARSALIFGNANYPQSRLRNAVNDANDVARLLEGLGFKVTLVTDGGRSAMLAGTESFMRGLGESEQVFVYYSGHGFQFGGQNYLIPIDALAGPASELKARSIPLALIMQQLAARRPAFSVLVLDACRENPASTGGGLAALDAPANTLIAFATGPGKMASDGGGKNGLYTSHLLRHLGAVDTGIEDVFKRVRVGVLEESGGQQMPWENTSLTASLLLAPRAGAPAAASAGAMPEGWLATASEAALRSYLARAPGAQSAAMRARTMDTLVALRARNRLRTGALALSQALCAGCPRMTPVASTPATWVSTDLVTRAEYQACVAARACAPAPRQPDGPDSTPLQSISLVAAQVYVRWLNDKASGYVFRIPSWEDWEARYRSGYFDQAGKPLFGSALQCEVGNFYDASGALVNQLPWAGAHCADGFAQAAPVGMFLPSRDGLFDLVGNLWQWTTSCAAAQGCSKYRLAGASWATGKTWPWDTPPQLSAEPDLQADLIGLRVFAARRH